MKRTKRTRAEKTAETRAAILHAAIEVAAELGYGETTVARVAERAGVALGSLYNHFENRRALMLEALTLASVEVIAAVGERVSKAPDGADLEQARFRALVEVHRERPYYGRLRRELEVFEPDAWREYTREVVEQSVERMRRLYGPQLAEMADADVVFMNAVLNGVAGGLLAVLDAYDFAPDRVEEAAALFGRFARAAFPRRSGEGGG